MTGLICDKCGTKPAPELNAVVGGTHYRRIEHGVGIPGRRGGFQLRTCGHWVAIARPAP